MPDQFIYCVTSPAVNTVKIGRHSGKLVRLLHRYKTYYGKNLELHAWPVECSKTAEDLALRRLAKYCLSGELFDKNYKLECIIAMTQVAAENAPQGVEVRAIEPMNMELCNPEELHCPAQRFSKFVCAPVKHRWGA